jgi:hypothetical protein
MINKDLAGDSLSEDVSPTFCGEIEKDHEKSPDSNLALHEK